MAKCFKSTNDRHTHTHMNYMSLRMEYWSKYLRSSILNNFLAFIAHIFYRVKKVTIVRFLICYFPVSVLLAFIETSGKYGYRAI